MEGPGQQPSEGGDCVPRAGGQSCEVQGAGGQQGQGAEGQETREVRDANKPQQRKEEGPMTEEEKSKGEGHGGQQPKKEEGQRADEQWQRKEAGHGTEEQQGAGQGKERIAVPDAQQQRKGKEPVAEEQQGQTQGLGEQWERMGEAHDGTKEHLPRWREGPGRGEQALPPRAGPCCSGQQKFEVEKEMRQDSVMKGPALQDALVCGSGPRELLAMEKEQWGLRKGQESRINELMRETGIEKPRHPNVNDEIRPQTPVAEPTKGPGTEAEEEGKSRIKDQKEAHTVPTGKPCTYLLTSDNISEVKQLEETIEEMLMRLDEFCGMTDMIRNETTQLLDEDIHAMKAKVEEMNKVYTKVDKLEAFVKMVGCHVTFLEDQLVQAERDNQPFTHVVQKLLQSASIPSFIYKHFTAKQQPYELPELFRTEDYIPLSYMANQYRKT